jgi:hypothetical protein
MTKHRRTKRRNQKGGWSLNPMNWFGSTSDSTVPTDPNAPTMVDKVKRGFQSGLVTVNDAVGSAAQSGMDAVGSAAQSGMDAVSSLNPFTSSDKTNVNTGENNANPVNTTGVVATGQNISNPVSTTGIVSTGGRRRRYRTMKGGKGGFGLTYYAAPVSGLKVAEPTYLITPKTNWDISKGGSRKRKGRKSRRTRRHRKH